MVSPVCDDVTVPECPQAPNFVEVFSGAFCTLSPQLAWAIMCWGQLAPCPALVSG